MRVPQGQRPPGSQVINVLVPSTSTPGNPDLEPGRAAFPATARKDLTGLLTPPGNHPLRLFKKLFRSGLLHCPVNSFSQLRPRRPRPRGLSPNIREATGNRGLAVPGTQFSRRLMQQLLYQRAGHGIQPGRPVRSPRPRQAAARCGPLPCGAAPSACVASLWPVPWCRKNSHHLVNLASSASTIRLPGGLLRSRRQDWSQRPCEGINVKQPNRTKGWQRQDQCPSAQQCLSSVTDQIRRGWSTTRTHAVVGHISRRTGAADYQVRLCQRRSQILKRH